MSTLSVFCPMRDCTTMTVVRTYKSAQLALAGVKVGDESPRSRCGLPRWPRVPHWAGMPVSNWEVLHRGLFSIEEETNTTEGQEVCYQGRWTFLQVRRRPGKLLIWKEGTEEDCCSLPSENSFRTLQSLMQACRVQTSYGFAKSN